MAAFLKCTREACRAYRRFVFIISKETLDGCVSIYGGFLYIRGAFIILYILQQRCKILSILKLLEIVNLFTVKTCGN